MGEERRSVPLSRRSGDLFLVSFLLMNIPVVLLFESQVLVPAKFVPKPLRDLTRSYVEYSGDYLVGDQPPFLKGLVFAEVLFQLPLLILNSYAFIADILAKKVPTQNLLIGIYIPYLIVPFIILARLVTTPHPFTEAVSIKKAKKGD